jgi:hypothetical protein
MLKSYQTNYITYLAVSIFAHFEPAGYVSLGDNFLFFSFSKLFFLQVVPARELGANSARAHYLFFPSAQTWPARFLGAFKTNRQLLEIFHFLLQLGECVTPRHCTLGRFCVNIG